jgi:restriction system protein
MANRAYYYREITHTGLNKYRMIRDADPRVVDQKATAQLLAWEAAWQKKSISDRKRSDRELRAYSKEEKKRLAAERTSEALSDFDGIRNTLKFALLSNAIFDWETLKDRSEFGEPCPRLPQDTPVPPEPKPVIPVFGFFDRLIPAQKRKKIAEAQAVSSHKYAEWQSNRERIIKQNHLERISYQETLKKWQNRKDAFLKQQEESNQLIENRKNAYLARTPEAIIDYCDLVLASSQYFESFPKDYEFDFNPDTGILIIDYALPAIDCLPKIREVKYVQSKDDFQDVFVSEAELNRIYDDLLYQISLRVIYELFEADSLFAINSFVFNGFVRSIDKASGKEINPCILSIHTTGERLKQINLANVDPKTCFKSLNGVSSTKLHTMVPVAPIIDISREDKRFVASHEVTSELDYQTNIAAMDWEDFEHLIRELFEKEFASGGGEVKVTRASRDYGVDAIAFDPDPIRGGKIVIQAKRYTNTVDVSSVRDLYGTVMNEGATKGILVTTADFGPEAHEFAKGKPLTLLNGGHLLHLLNKHGHRAKIDIQEARKFLGLKNRANNRTSNE